MDNTNIQPIKSNKSKKIMIYAAVTAAIITLLFLAIRFNPLISQNSPISSTSQTAIKPAKASQTLNREFSFPLKDEKGAEIGKVKYTVENAELMDEIIVGGKKASSVKGRTFLILNLKIVNDTSQAISMATKDYVRLIIDNKEAESLAPDIHNDPVTVQAISTKFTRVGFPINDSDKNLKIKIGEIKGEKQTVDLKLN